MAFELRRLEFSPDELISAAIEYCRDDRIALPEAEVERVEIAPAPEPSLVMVFRVHRPMDPDTVALTASQLVSALARYCLRHAIPLPRAAEKRLQYVNGRLTMLFSIEHRCRRKALVAV
jgi:hypothetical protein